jgi:hypothetical protein
MNNGSASSNEADTNPDLISGGPGGRLRPVIDLAGG